MKSAWEQKGEQINHVCVVSPKCREDTGHLLLLVCLARVDQCQEFIRFNVSFVVDALQHGKIKVIPFWDFFLGSVESSASPELLWFSISPQSIIYWWGEDLKTAAPSESSGTWLSRCVWCTWWLKPLGLSITLRIAFLPQNKNILLEVGCAKLWWGHELKSNALQMSPGCLYL